MKKYWGIFRNNVLAKFEYRTNLIGTLLIELVGVFGVVILYWSIFSTNKTIAGYDLVQILSYYLLIPLVGFITQVYVSNDLPEQIRYGNFSSHLLKPYKIWLGNLAGTIAGKINYLLMVIPVWMVIIIFVSNRIGRPLIETRNIMPALIVCCAALLMHYFMDLTITWLAFWFDDIWSFQHFKNILFEFLGGVSFPLAFLPEKFRAVVDLLPFKYLYYVPVTYLNGKTPAKNLSSDLVVIGVWFCVFAFLSWILWKRGLKKYGAYGN